MLQAMNTGHDGSLTTVHANTPRDALARLENLVGLFISTNAIVVAPFLAILVTLVLRPQGLLGGKVQVKKV